MRLLVIEAHPQYAGMFISGMIYKHTQRGDEVHVVALADAECLTNIRPQAELAEINKAEARAACEILGVTSLRFLGYPDTFLLNTHELRLHLSDIIREIKPEIIVSHWPQDTLSDFRETGMAAIDAAFNALLVAGRWVEKYPSHWTKKLYAFQHPGLSVNFKPTTFIDISDILDVKTRAMDCFKIQIECNFGNDLEKWHSFILGPNRYWGVESGCMYAEPYAQMEIHEVHNNASSYLAV
jgi:LmbE family N-acetylglucosaminyl deacetylase